MLAEQKPFISVAEKRRLQRASEAPAVSACLLRWFGWYGQRLLRKKFHAVRIARDGVPAAADGPLVIYLNHASWWDPMVALFLHRHFFPDRLAYAPIEAAALRRYPFFRRLGFFGVEQGTVRGGVQFIRKAEAILRKPDTALWLTPQGRFADVRERPLRFQPGIGHLVTRRPELKIVPLAIEYVFWEERSPEVLVRFGKALSGFHFVNSLQALRTLEAELTDTQDKLAASAKARGKEDLYTLLSGASGVGGCYDLWRRFRAGLRGETFNPSHGSL